MPDVPGPEDVAKDEDIRTRVLPKMPEAVRRFYERERPIKLRPVELDRYLGRKIEGGRFHVWMRAAGKLPDEPAIHQCVLAYASDMLLLVFSNTVRPCGIRAESRPVARIHTWKRPSAMRLPR